MDENIMIIDLTKSKNVLINLEQDKIRLSESSKQLEKVNIPFERFEAIKHTKGVVGCGLSHRKVLSENINYTQSTGLLVLEDDVELTGLTNNLVFDLPDDTDAMYLGISKYGFVPRFNGGIFESVFSANINSDYKRIFNMCSTHAIIYLSERYINSVIQTIDFCLKTDVPFDLGIASIHKNFNIVTPKNPMFFQKDQPEATRFVL